jgi:hypothetical protein
LKTFLFFIHMCPPESLLICNALPGAPLLGTSLRLVTSALADTSKYAVRFVRALLAFVVPCAYGCFEWSFQAVELNDIHGAISPLFQLTAPVSRGFADRVLQCSEELLALFFVIVMKRSLYLEFLVERRQGMSCLAALIFLWNDSFENGTRSFANWVIAALLAQLLANPRITMGLNAPFVGVVPGMHEGSYADVLVESLTNPIVNAKWDVDESIDVIVLVCDARVKLSSFAANRLLLLIKGMWMTKSQSLGEIGKLVAAIERLLADVFVDNFPLLVFCLDYARLWKEIHMKGIRAAGQISRIVGEIEETIQMFDEEKRAAKLAECQKKVFREERRETLTAEAYELKGEVEKRWMDWLRSLFWNLLPELTMKFSVDESPTFSATSGSWWLF